MKHRPSALPIAVGLVAVHKAGRTLESRKTQRVEEIQTLTRSETESREQQWRDFFKMNCNALFQIALLLTADAVTAEVALAKSIEDLDISNSPGQTGVAAWERATAMRSIEIAQSSPSIPDPMTRTMLQPALQPIIEIGRFPRICFVLRLLLGYTTALCAQMLGIEESGVRMLFQMAVIQLQQKAHGIRQLMD